MPAGGGVRGHLNRRSGQIRSARRVKRDATQTGHVGRQGVLILNKDRRNGLVAVHHDIAGIGRARQVVRPVIEMPAAGGIRGDLDRRSGQVRAARRVERDAARAGHAGRQRVLILHEQRRDRLVAVHHDCGRAGRACEIAGPLKEVPAADGHGRQLHRRAGEIHPARRAQHDAALTRRTHRGRQRVLILHEHRRHGLVAVHQDIAGIRRARQVARPVIEMPAGDSGRR